MTPLPDPLERLRAVNPVPAPIEPDWARVREHVERALRVGASYELAAPAPARARLSRLRAARRGRHTAVKLAGAVALCAALAVAALVAFAPSSGSPGFLARAAAALTPRADTVLYERWEHVIAAEPGNPVYDHRVSVGPEQLWIDGRFPRRYRAILEPDRDVGARYDLAFAYGVNVGYVGRGFDLADGQNEVLDELQRKLAGKPLELGGTLRSPSGRTPHGATLPSFTFVPPDELLKAKLTVTLGASLPGPHRGVIEDGADPVGALRAAIAEGRAREAGSRQFNGRTVERIDFELPKHPPADAPPLPADAPKIHSEAYAYVEPDSFHPLEIVYGRDTYRFLAYEYLPASAANRALASISLQHPSAKITRHP